MGKHDGGIELPLNCSTKRRYTRHTDTMSELRRQKQESLFSRRPILMSLAVFGIGVSVFTCGAVYKAADAAYQ